MGARAVYEGNSGDVTRAYYERLQQLGPRGLIALNLFRAQKCSTRAKVYSRKYRALAYERKDWSLGQLCAALREHAAALGITWGYGRDDATEGFPWVLYVDLPTGQVSFHARARKPDCPDYAGAWDGCGDSARRIINYCDEVTGDGRQGQPTAADGAAGHDPRQGGEEGRQLPAGDV